nr:ABC transporter ATP-binding protein [uncultured Dongia sp.]
MANLLLDDISKTYAPRAKAPIRAVKQVRLDIKDGEIVALLGSSGCGKTSMLRMVAGFEEVTEGAIRIGGQEIHNLPPSQRGVAMAFEGYSLYPPLKVRENVAFALLREKKANAEIEARVRQVAELLEITDILDRYPTVISAGQQQRTSLARALIRRAPVSLLDEPMSQLEPQLRAIVRARLKDYLIEHKMTTLFVTHDQTEAIALADRIAVMEKGELQQFGTPAEIKERPNNLFVASFVGEPPMNIFDAHLDHAGDHLRINALGAGGQAAFSLKAPLLENVAGQDVRIGIRPHLITLGADASPTSEDAVATGRIISNHWLGDQSHICLDVAGTNVVCVTERPVETEIGKALALRVPAKAVHLFDAVSGRALAHGLASKVH